MDILESRGISFFENSDIFGLRNEYFFPQPLRFKAERQPFSLEKIIKLWNGLYACAGCWWEFIHYCNLTHLYYINYDKSGVLA